MLSLFGGSADEPTTTTQHQAVSNTADTEESDGRGENENAGAAAAATASGSSSSDYGIYYAIRTAYRGANSYHNSNRLTYKTRNGDFRALANGLVSLSVGEGKPEDDNAREILWHANARI